VKKIPSIYNRSRSRILLAVDRNRGVQRLVRHTFDECFYGIYTATFITETEMILRNFPITHLLCELDMDEPDQRIVLTAQWRRMYPDISRVCIFSGRTESMRMPDHIDGFFFKGDPIIGLRSMLLPPEHEAATLGTPVGGNQ
jgi:hypothetical protein